MEHGITGAAGYAGAKLAPPQQDRPLDRIAHNADRIERLAYIVEQFTDRFYSGPCETANAASTLRGVPAGYSAQIDRLTEGTDRLDKAIQRLTDIG